MHSILRNPQYYPEKTKKRQSALFANTVQSRFQQVIQWYKE